MKLITLFMSLLLLIATKECGDNKDADTSDKSKQATSQMDMNGAYKITKVGKNDFSDYDITMIIEMGAENKISGVSACNQYFGTFENPKDNEVIMGMLAGSKMYCQDVADVEKEYMNTLRLVTSVQPTKKGLHLLNKAGEVILVAIKKETK